WETLDQLRTPTVTVTGSASSRAPRFDYELAYACGVQPTEDRFVTIGAAAGVTAPLADVPLGTWSVRDAALRCAIERTAVPTTAPSGTTSPNDTPDEFTVTLRLRVTDSNNRRGESRRTVYVHHDRDLLPHFPLGIGGSGEPSPLFVKVLGTAA